MKVCSPAAKVSSMDFDKDALEAFDAHGKQLMDEAADRETLAIEKLLANLEKSKEQS